jgi:hypothetical protein
MPGINLNEFEDDANEYAGGKLSKLLSVAPNYDSRALKEHQELNFTNQIASYYASGMLESGRKTTERLKDQEKEKLVNKKDAISKLFENDGIHYDTEEKGNENNDIKSLGPLLTLKPVKTVDSQYD